MNRFILSTSPTQAARQHCDAHVRKMILEEAQMLSTAHHVLGSWSEEMYRPTHINHPCARWVRESSENYFWGYFLLEELCNEYTFRYGKVHSTSRLLEPLLRLPSGIPDAPMTDFPLAMPDAFKSCDPVASYRKYYLEEKSRFAKWTTREIPSWWITKGEQE